jgi:hypothetical protein
MEERLLMASSANSRRQGDDTLTGTDIIPVPGEDLPEDPKHIQDPAEYAAATDDLRQEYQEQQEDLARNMFRDHPPAQNAVPGTIDVARFLTAQAKFVQAQMDFMQHGRRRPDADLLGEVTRFSYAQSDFIEAQNQVLRDLGVI